MFTYRSTAVLHRLTALFLVLWLPACKTTPPTVTEAMLALNECTNSKGSKLETLSQSLLGDEVYKDCPDLPTFNLRFDLCPEPKRMAWGALLSDQFFADAQYKACISEHIDPIRKAYLAPAGTPSQKELISLMNQPQYQTLGHTIPYIIMLLSNPNPPAG
jgi:hypothetical protein